MISVGDHIRAAMLEPWDWGRHDCCTWIAAWVVSRGRADPMGFIRGRYATERGALLHIRRGGGLVALWARGMGDSGLEPLNAAERPLAGDIGVIARQTACGTNEAAALFSGERWVTLGVRGIDSGPAEVLAMWRP